MFEPYKLLEKSLLASGSVAKAEVLSAEPAASAWDSGVTYTNNPMESWEVSLRVTPPEEPTFEVSLRMRISSYVSIARGAVLDVLYDPKKHTRIIVDPRTVPQSASEMMASATEVRDAEMLAAAARNNAQMAEFLKNRRQGTAAPRGNVASRLEQLERLKQAGMIDEL